jgi:hypothetical protein
MLAASFTDLKYKFDIYLTFPLVLNIEANASLAGSRPGAAWPDGTSGRYWSDAIQAAIWARELKASLLRMLRTWLSTVGSEMNRRVHPLRAM